MDGTRPQGDAGPLDDYLAEHGIRRSDWRTKAGDAAVVTVVAALVVAGESLPSEILSDVALGAGALVLSASIAIGCLAALALIAGGRSADGDLRSFFRSAAYIFGRRKSLFERIWSVALYCLWFGAFAVFGWWWMFGATLAAWGTVWICRALAEPRLAEELAAFAEARRPEKDFGPEPPLGPEEPAGSEDASGGRRGRFDPNAGGFSARREEGRP